jgi:hypothetical protein
VGELTRIPLKDFSKNPTDLINRVVRERIKLIGEKDGEPIAVLKPVRATTKRRRK